MRCTSIQKDPAYINDQGVVVYHTPDSLFVFYPNVPFNIIFIKSSSYDAFCVDSYLMACYDNNMNSYQSCLFLESQGKHELTVSSVDSCTEYRFKNNGRNFMKVHFNHNHIAWDSVRVSVSDYTNTTIGNIRFSEAENIRFKDHPFNAGQEIFFLCNTNFGPFLSTSTKHIYYKFEVFHKGRLIMLKEGDILPSIFKSVLSAHFKS